MAAVRRIVEELGRPRVQCGGLIRHRRHIGLVRPRNEILRLGIAESVLVPSRRPHHVVRAVRPTNDRWIARQLLDTDCRLEERAVVLQRAPRETVRAVREVESVLSVPLEVREHVVVVFRHRARGQPECLDAIRMERIEPGNAIHQLARQREAGLLQPLHDHPRHLVRTVVVEVRIVRQLDLLVGIRACGVVHERLHGLLRPHRLVELPAHRIQVAFGEGDVENERLVARARIPAASRKQRTEAISPLVGPGDVRAELNLQARTRATPKMESGLGRRRCLRAEKGRCDDHGHGERNQTNTHVLLPR